MNFADILRLFPQTQEGAQTVPLLPQQTPVGTPLAPPPALAPVPTTSPMPAPTSAPQPTGLADVVSPQPAAQQPQAPQADSYEARKSGWLGLMDKLKDPTVQGPLQTFLLTMSAPYGYNESVASRLGRAVALSQLHRNMLQQNAADKPRQDALDQAELDKAQAVATGAQADASLKQTNAKLANDTFDIKVQAMQQDLQNAVTQGRLTDANLTLSQLKTTLMQKYGAQEAEAKLAEIRARTFRDRALGSQAKAAGADADKVWTRQVNTAKGLVQGTIAQFKAANPNATKDDFYKWLDDQKWTNPDLSKVHQAVGIMMGEGIDPFKDLQSGAAPTSGQQQGPIDAATVRARLEADKKNASQKLDAGRNPQFQGDPNYYYPSIWDQ